MDVSTETLLLLLGVFAGGAIPWLEAIIVIPGGIAAGLHPVPALVAGVSGNLLTVGVAAWFGDSLRTWWIARRSKGDEPLDPDPVKSRGPSRRRARIERIVDRYGLPVLAVVGPLGIGTQLSAMVAVGLGHGPRTAFAWIGAATVAWGVIAAVATVAGLSLLGIGE